MSLNEIELPTVLLPDLYGSTLVTGEKINPGLIPAAAQQPDHAEEKTRPYLGENRKNILVLVKDPIHPVIEDEALKLLTDILGACKLGIADVLVYNVSGLSTKFTDLKKEFNPESILLFGVSQEEMDLPLHFPDFQVQAISGKQFLSSPGLQEIKEDKVLKSKLWVSLRKLFNI